MQLAIRGCEVNCDSHVDVPACLEVIHETRLLADLKLSELDIPCRFNFCLLINQLSFFVRLLIQNFFGRDLARAVEQIAAIGLPRVEREAKRTADLLVAELEHVDVDLFEDGAHIAFVVVALLKRVPHFDPIDHIILSPIAVTLPFDQEPRVILRWLAEAEKALLALFLGIFDSACDVHLCDIVAR